MEVAVWWGECQLGEDRATASFLRVRIRVIGCGSQWPGCVCLYCPQPPPDGLAEVCLLTENGESGRRKGPSSDPGAPGSLGSSGSGGSEDEDSDSLGGFGKKTLHSPPLRRRRFPNGRPSSILSTADHDVRPSSLTAGARSSGRSCTALCVSAGQAAERRHRFAVYVWLCGCCRRRSGGG